MKRAFAVVTVLALGLVASCGGGNTRSGGTGGTAGTGGSGGGTGGSSAGGTSGSGGYGATGATGGTSSVECQKIEEGYEAAVAEAKACNPLINTILCTQLVNDKLACPCSTYVNPQNTQALTKMYDLEEQWKSSGCGTAISCPAIACTNPQGAGCIADATGSSGNCQDYWPD